MSDAIAPWVHERGSASRTIIIRTGTGPSTEIRADVLRDCRLSFRARGVYCFLATLPPGSEPTPRWIASQSPDTLYAVRNALRELEAHGYIEPTGMSPLRVSIPLKLRYQALRRDGYACRYCGARAPKTPLVVDHVLPVSRNGKTELENLITACDPCNTGKSDAVPEAWLVEEVQNATAEWLAKGVPDDFDDAEMVRPRGRGHIAVQIIR